MTASTPSPTNNSSSQSAGTGRRVTFNPKVTEHIVTYAAQERTTALVTPRRVGAIGPAAVLCPRSVLHRKLNLALDEVAFLQSLQALVGFESGTVRSGPAHIGADLGVIRVEFYDEHNTVVIGQGRATGSLSHDIKPAETVQQFLVGLRAAFEGLQLPATSASLFAGVFVPNPMAPHCWEVQ